MRVSHIIYMKRENPKKMDTIGINFLGGYFLSPLTYLHDDFSIHNHVVNIYILFKHNKIWTRRLSENSIYYWGSQRIFSTIENRNGLNNSRNEKYLFLVFEKEREMKLENGFITLEWSLLRARIIDRFLYFIVWYREMKGGMRRDCCLVLFTWVKHIIKTAKNVTFDIFLEPI